MPRRTILPRKDEPEGDPRLLEPGWAGIVDDAELRSITARLFADAALSRQWGFRPSQRTRNEQAVRRVAADGKPDDIAHNRALARPRSHPDTSRAGHGNGEGTDGPVSIAEEMRSPVGTMQTPHPAREPVGSPGQLALGVM